MPITEHIRDHDLLGPVYKRGFQEGFDRGVLVMVRRLIEARFGSIPSWAEERLAHLSTTQLEDLGFRLLDVNTLEELFP
jgi:Domain of unknown function (DUF4351)